MEDSTARSRPGTRARHASRSDVGGSRGPGRPPTTRAAAVMAVVKRRCASWHVGARTTLTAAATRGRTGWGASARTER